MRTEQSRQKGRGVKKKSRPTCSVSMQPVALHAHILIQYLKATLSCQIVSALTHGLLKIHVLIQVCWKWRKKKMNKENLLRQKKLELKKLLLEKSVLWENDNTEEGAYWASRKEKRLRARCTKQKLLYLEKHFFMSSLNMRGLFLRSRALVRLTDEKRYFSVAASPSYSISSTGTFGVS